MKLLKKVNIYFNTDNFKYFHKRKYNELERIKWLSYNKNSCYLDSFLTCYCLVIYNKYEFVKEVSILHPNYIFVEQLNLLTESFETNTDYLNNNRDMFMEYLANEKYLENDLGDFWFVYDLFKLLDGFQQFKISLLIDFECKKCNKKRVIEDYISSPIYLTIDDIPSKNQENNINSYLANNLLNVCRDYKCIECGREWINNNYTITGILPQFIIVLINFINMAEYKNLFIKINDIFEITIKDTTYILTALILSPKLNNHFTTHIIDPYFNYTKYEGNYYHDNFQNNGYLIIKIIKKRDIRAKSISFIIY